MALSLDLINQTFCTDRIPPACRFKLICPGTLRVMVLQVARFRNGVAVLIRDGHSYGAHASAIAQFVQAGCAAAADAIPDAISACG